MMTNKREYWLDGYKGPCKGGIYFRSAIFVELEEFEKRTGKHIVGIKFERKDNGDPSYNIELVVEASHEEIEKVHAEETIIEEPDAYDEYGRAIKYVDDGRENNE